MKERKKVKAKTRKASKKKKKRKSAGENNEIKRAHQINRRQSVSGGIKSKIVGERRDAHAPVRAAFLGAP